MQILPPLQIQADIGAGCEHVVRVYEAVLTHNNLCLVRAQPLFSRLPPLLGFEKEEERMRRLTSAALGQAADFRGCTASMCSGHGMRRGRQPDQPCGCQGEQSQGDWPVPFRGRSPLLLQGLMGRLGFCCGA